MTTRRINLVMPIKLIEEVDSFVGGGRESIYTNRSEFIRECVREKLGELKKEDEARTRLEGVSELK